MAGKDLINAGVFHVQQDTHLIYFCYIFICKTESKKKINRGKSWCQSTWIFEKVNIYAVFANPAHTLQEKQIPPVNQRGYFIHGFKWANRVVFCPTVLLMQNEDSIAQWILSYHMLPQKENQMQVLNKESLSLKNCRKKKTVVERKSEEMMLLII